jgi:Ca-activated chloride channel family protein
MCPKALRSLICVSLTVITIASLLEPASTGLSARLAATTLAAQLRRGKNGQATRSEGNSAAEEALQNKPNSETQSSKPEPPRPPQRREPPPFDRPPASSDSSPSSTARPPDTSDIQQGQARVGRTPPVLRRPSDPRPQAEPRSDDTNDRQTGAGSSDGTDVIKLDATLVNIPLLVSDRAGRYVPNLTARDFEVYEDGVKQEIAFFGNEEVPFSVALLLDISPSVMNSLEDIQEAAVEFVRQLRSQDRVMVVAFDHNVRYLTDFTNDRRALEYAIRSTHTGSGTSVYEAVYYTVSQKLRQVQGRKAMILLSDGEDTTSRRISYDDAINIVTESDVLVYGLRYPSSNFNYPSRDPWPYPRTRIPIPMPLPFPFPWPRPRWPRGPFGYFVPRPPIASTANLNADPPTPAQRRHRSGDFMQDLATAGGGPVYDATTIHDLSRLARQIADELRHVYMVSYYPTNPLSNGGYRTIRVQVKGRDDIAVRHRRGYNAEEITSNRRAVSSILRRPRGLAG